MSDAEEAFLFYLRTLAPEVPMPDREYRFDKSRKWRFDFAWVASKIAVEIDGGAYSQGRHTRGIGFDKDNEKTNAAQRQGWRVFRFTPQAMKRDPEKCIDVFRALIKTEELRQTAASLRVRNELRLMNMPKVIGFIEQDQPIPYEPRNHHRIVR